MRARGDVPDPPEAGRPPGPPALPRSARRYLAFTILLGIGSLAWAFAAASTSSASRELLATSALIVGVGTWLQVRSFQLTWNGQRLAVHADEALLLVAFLFAPAPHVVLAATTASLLGQLALRKPLLKLSFNVAAQTIATAAGAATFLLLTRMLGMPPLASALVTPLIISGANQLLVVALLTRVSPEKAWNTRALLASVTMSTTTGVLVGITAVALYHLHPALIALLVPLGWIVGRILDAGYRQENEAIARQRLAEATQRMLEEPDESAVLNAALEACQSALSPLAAGIEVQDRGRKRELRAGGEVVPGRGRVIECALSAPGGIDGRIWILSAHAMKGSRDSDAALLQAFASTVALGVANARTLSRLRRSERRLRDAFEATPDPILVLDKRQVVVYANGAAVLTAPRDGRIVGASVRDVFSFPEGELFGDVELRLTADATRVWEAKVAPLRLEDDEEGLVLITREVTERRRLERETQLQQEALARAERLSSLGTLVAGVAHEVNNPLAYMTAGIDLVMLDMDDVAEELRGSELELERVDLNETKRRLASIQSGAARIGEITKALKVVARTTNAKEDVLIDVAGLARELELLVRPLVPPAIKLIVETRDAPRILGSPSDLQRALLNLAKNALEAMGQGPGSLIVRVGAAADACKVEVIDDGPGMPPEVRARAFTPFFTTKHDGTGLGLPTVFGVITAHEGTIALESEVGRGTHFTITLPAADGSTKRARPPIPGSGRHDRS